MRKAFLYALRSSVPILVSFCPLGIACGILMQKAGYNALWTMACSVFVFAGSLQYLMVTLFAGGLSLVTVALMALLLNSRHIFYGIPLIEKWSKYPRWRPFLIFSLIDETFPLHITNTFDDGNDRHKMFSFIFTGALAYLYWITFTVLGGLVGSLVTFNTAGLDFAMTAMFIVILMEQIRGKGSKLPILISLVSGIACLLLIGPANFILPALMITVVLLYVFRGRIEEVEK